MTTNVASQGVGVVLAAVFFFAAGSAVPARELSLDERVAAQTAIEQVYWNHRIWPQENAAPKPPLSAVMSAEAIRAKVESGLRMSKLLETFWRRPITADDLQAELNRMVKETQSPGTLREIFAALHDDPLLIAECVARPGLARRLVEAAFAYDDRIHGTQHAAIAATMTAVTDIAGLTRAGGERSEIAFMRDALAPADGGSPSPSDPAIHLQEDAWRHEISTVEDVFGPPTAGGAEALAAGRISKLFDDGDRYRVLGVRDKSESRVSLVSVSWPKRDLTSWMNERISATDLDARPITPPAGGYRLLVPETGCVDDTWTATSPSSLTERYLHTAVWTGSEMIVWGGSGYFGAMTSGGRYDPVTNSWASSSLNGGAGANTASARYLHTAVWTGTEMIVWGGAGTSGLLATGGRYNPATDSWIASSLNAGTGANVPAARYSHTAVWTGSEMIVWGGQIEGPPYYTANGGRYNPSTDSWAACSLTAGTGANVPGIRTAHTAVWTGSEMIVWGGLGTVGFLRTGGRYNPATDTWAVSQLTSGAGAYAASARYAHTTVWTGSEMIVWGGYGPFGTPSTGGRYHPATDSWSSSSLTLGTGDNVPAGRVQPSAVWTGSELIVWGGYRFLDGSAQFESTGGRYYPSADVWFPSSLATGSGLNVPSARYDHTAVWTGSADHRMIVWGGYPFTNTGAVYCAQECTPQAWYLDADGDGHGDAAASASACVRPAGYAASSDDCDDTRSSVYPGAPERCDGLDNDCDAGTPIDVGGDSLCDDSNPCTDGVCGAAGCVYTNTTGSCDDGDVCTTNDTCASGVCGGAPLSGIPCTDGNACTTGDTCVAGVCAPGPGTPSCDDGSVCTDDSCDRLLGCVHDRTNAGDLCDDGNPCTINACDPVLFCVFPLSPAGTACSDDDLCTTGDACDGQANCVSGAPTSCDDRNPCTDDACDPATGCAHTNNSGACDDGNACTRTDHCSGGLCFGGNSVFCPTDQCHFPGTCDPATGVCSNQTRPDGSYCDDGSLCTTGESCQAGVCTPETSGLNNPTPKTSGYYEQLCQKWAHGQLPWHGDTLTSDDAYCVGWFAYRFYYIYTVDQLCEVLARGGQSGHPCERADDELVATALNICRGRVCEEQHLDSRCDGNVGTTVAVSFNDANWLLYDDGRTDEACSAATCELREINNGHALEMNSLIVSTVNHQIVLAWVSPILDDGTGAPDSYEIWRRPLRSGAAFTKIGTTSGLSFIDATAGSGVWEYEITAVIP